MKDFIIQINPQEIAEEYLRGLNSCFPNWGDQKQFDWYFHRETLFPTTDVITMQHSQEIAAGSAITYRRVWLPQEKEIPVGIMTGSWTLPEFRGHGLFARLIEESLKQAAIKKAELLLAFVTAENASRRQLERTGAQMFPSWYLFSNEKAGLPSASYSPRVTENEKNVEEIFDRYRKSRAGFAHFVYPSAQSFRALYLDRLNDTEGLITEQGELAIIEKKMEMNVLLFSESENKENLEAYVRHAAEEKRSFFTFTMQEETARAAEGIGLQAKNGFLVALTTEECDFSLDNKINWYVQNGDRV